MNLVQQAINAISLGDRAAKYFPRAFLDADCQLSENLLQRVAEEFEDPDVRIVAPGVKYAVSLIPSSGICRVAVLPGGARPASEAGVLTLEITTACAFK